MAEVSIFDRPIPGQSLTTEPRNNPWENPPELTTIEEVTAFYIERLAKEEVIDDLVAMAQGGVSLKPIVEGTYMQGVMRGVHTLDAGLLVAPILTTFLRETIKSYGVDVKDTGEDLQEKANKQEMQRFQVVASRMLAEQTSEPDEGKDMLQDMMDTQEETPEEVTQEEQPQGLMAKGQ